MYKLWIFKCRKKIKLKGEDWHEKTADQLHDQII